MKRFKKNIFKTITEEIITPSIDCISYTVSTSSAQSQGYRYYNCNGTLVENASIGGIGGYEADTFCAQNNSVVLIGSELTLVNNGSCTEINIVSVDSDIVQCGAGDDTKIITNSVLLSRAVTVDTIFVVETVYSINGSCITSLNSAFSDVTILAGNTNGDSPGCFSGAPSFPPDTTAVICSKHVTSHNNVVDDINIVAPA